MTTNDLSAAAAFAPVGERERVDSVDVIRGVATLGILLMNIVGMGLPDPAYWDPSGWGGDTGWNLRVWWVGNLCVEGTQRALFSMLFGAGFLLFTGKAADKDGRLPVADAWYRRTIWLSVFGFVHAYILLWPGEILYAYGLMGLFLFPLRNVRPGRLFASGLALLLAGAGFYLWDNLRVLELHRLATAAEEVQASGGKPSPEQEAAQKEWIEKEAEMKPSLEQREEVVRAMQGGYRSAMATRAAMTYWMHTEFHYRYVYFDVLSMMLIGMALFKWRVLHAALAPWKYWLMVAAGYGLGIPLNWYETATYARSGFDLVTNYQVGVTYDLGRLLMVTGHLGTIMLFCRSGVVPTLARGLAAVGRMALTNYILHTVFTTTVFVGFAQFGRWERHQLYLLVAAIWAFQLTVSPLWLRRFHFGPLEWCWRSLTYLRRPPFRRRIPAAT